MPPVFVEFLIKGMKNEGNDMGYDDDPIEDYRQIPFKKLYMMCSEDLE